ncbi:protein kinase superfamily protein [Wolffia australiana]
MNCTISSGFLPGRNPLEIRKIGFRYNFVDGFVQFSQRAGGKRCIRCVRSCLVTDAEDFEVGRFIGSYGFMNVTSYSSLNRGGFSGGGLYQMEASYSTEDIERLKVQDVGEGQVKIRLYEGRISKGPIRGTRVIFKVYPGLRAGGVEADMMAANEVNCHAFLQGKSGVSQNIQILLGGFETKTGEQWLAFRNDGIYSAADYSKITSEDIFKYRNEVGQISWNPMVWEEKMRRRRKFVLKLLYGAMSGLDFLHSNERLHQSIGPASVVLNTVMEKDVNYLVPRLRDLAFSVDIRYSSFDTSPGMLSEGLWRRASAAGTLTLLEKRAFGIADDIFEAGLLFLYMSFLPFCEAGAVDGLSLQRLFEGTFQLDLEAAREYCLEDDRLREAVKFLDLGNRAGWELLQAMLNPDYRQRPTASAVLSHRFMTSTAL